MEINKKHTEKKVPKDLLDVLFSMSSFKIYILDKILLYYHTLKFRYNCKYKICKMLFI